MKPAQIFNPRLMLGLVAAGIVAFAALLLLMAYGGGERRPSRDGGAHALSESAVGYSGLVSLVGELREAYLVREDYELESENLLVIAVEPQSDRSQLRRLLERRRGLATLLILPKWITVRHDRRRDWVRSVGILPGFVVAAPLGDGFETRAAEAHTRLPRRIGGRDILAGLQLPVPRQAQILIGETSTPLAALAVAGRTGALVARLGDQPHYVVADPDLMNNHGLSDPATARAALALIDRLNSTDAESVDFDLTLNGLGAAEIDPNRRRNLLQLAFEPPFLVMTLALFAAALLAGLHGAVRFGPARPELRAIALGKAALVENSAGLIRLAEREADLGGAYADVVRLEAARAAAAPHWLQGEALDRYLNRLGKPGRPSFSELAADLYNARDRHALMAAARALFQWKKDIIR
jgi:hypothetical protein